MKYTNFEIERKKSFFSLADGERDLNVKTSLHLLSIHRAYISGQIWVDHHLTCRRSILSDLPDFALVGCMDLSSFFADSGCFRDLP